MTLLITCDPGKEGGFAFWRNGRLLATLRTACHIRTFINHVVKLRKGDEFICSWIEDVHGVEGQPASTTFTFGHETGKAMAMLELVSDEYVHKITPQKWQGLIEVPAGMDYYPRKKWVCGEMSQVYSYASVMMWTADAIGIGHALKKLQEAGELSLPGTFGTHLPAIPLPEIIY